MANIKKLPLFVRCVIQNFPFIEEDFDAVTNYQLISKVVEFLNKVIASQNEVIGVANDLQVAFQQLHDYVENYFDNLDVQEEINNKLDEMVENGTLQEIITTYIQSNVAWVFDNVADMQEATNLVDGSYARTLGYTTKGDGGGAYYSISSTSQAGSIALANDLYAIFTPVSNLVYSIESFAGSNGEEKLFNALDTIDRGVILAGKVEINHQYTGLAKDYRNITILGATIKLNTQMWFIQSGTTYKSVPAFKNCTIEGLNNKFFDNSSNVIGMLFDGCHIKATQMFNANYYAQSPYFLNCTFESEENLITAKQIYDLKMIGCRIESGTESLIVENTNGIMQATIDGCLIEGRSNVIVQCTSCFVFDFKNCYLESNNGGVLEQIGSSGSCYLNFKDNWVIGSMTNTDYLITIGSSAFSSARITNNITNLAEGKYICNRKYNLLATLKNENKNYVNSWKGSGYKPYLERSEVLNGERKTGTFDSDNNEWVCTFQLPAIEAYKEIHPLYLYFAGNFGSDTTYQGFAIIRLDIWTIKENNTSTLHVEPSVITGRNKSNTTDAHDITATASLNTTAYNATDVLVTVRISGFKSRRGEYRVIDPFTILEIDQEK